MSVVLDGIANPWYPAVPDTGKQGIQTPERVFKIEEKA
jgi:hypothetical protein